MIETSQQINTGVTECIILAGGLGTRLREAVPELPKAMAPVAGRPFLSYVINYLRMQGVQQFIFSLGYRSEAIIDYLEKEYPLLQYKCVVEEEPLGTGGAIQLAMKEAVTEQVLVVNGDTIFEVDLEGLAAFHDSVKAECTLALKPMKNFDRYGLVEIDEAGQVISFREKQYYDEGFINGGVYLVNHQSFFRHSFPQKFSFEKDYLEPHAAKGVLYGKLDEGYFIDIGIPGDFQKADRDFQRKPLDLSAIDQDWSLFLDRDGVINEEIPASYVMLWKEFVFSKGVLDVMKKLSDSFGHVFVVSNQRGVGRGLMTEEMLKTIHFEMQREVEVVGGRIDRIYYCTEEEDHHFFRKPNPGMALLAKKEFPGIDFGKSIMVGNKPGDMKFGRAAGMYTVFITSTNPGQSFPHPDIDAVFPSLYEFAKAIETAVR